MIRPDLHRRVREYANGEGLQLGEQLGSGVHGIVFDATKQTNQGRVALKVHERDTAYYRERDVYLRLQSLGITQVCGCNVPQLVDFNDDLMVIQMTIVT